MRAAPEAEIEPTDAPASDSHALARDGASALGATPWGSFATALLASARHELRSPLHAIQGFAELLESGSYGALTSEQRTFVEHILQGGTQLGAVVETCLELAEIELLGTSPSTSPHELNSALEEALAHVRERVRTPLDVRLPRAEAGPLYVRVDPASLARALSSLVIALAAASTRSLTIQLEHPAEGPRLQVIRAARLPAPALMSLEELVARQGNARNLIWLRLAERLLAHQDAQLCVSEDLDRAEVRFRATRGLD